MPPCVLRRGIPLVCLSGGSEAFIQAHSSVFQDSCGISDPFLPGIYMHINKNISKDAWHFMPGTGLGDAREEG